MVYCQNCGSPQPEPLNETCPLCGAPLPMMIVAPHPPRLIPMPNRGLLQLIALVVLAPFMGAGGWIYSQLFTSLITEPRALPFALVALFSMAGLGFALGAPAKASLTTLRDIVRGSAYLAVGELLELGNTDGSRHRRWMLIDGVGKLTRQRGISPQDVGKLIRIVYTPGRELISYEVLGAAPAGRLGVPAETHRPLLAYTGVGMALALVGGVFAWLIGLAR